MSKIEYKEDGKIERRFTPEWKNSGRLDLEDLPKLAISTVAAIESMVGYIQELHNEIDCLKSENEELKG